MKRSNKGFTLIELMIVVAIIAIIAAIAIPSLLRSKMSANHSNAGAALKSLVTQEGIWRSQDIDKNGTADYWILDVRGFHGVKDAAGNPVKLIDAAFANADRFFAAANSYDYAGVTAAATPKQGYLFQALSGYGAGTAGAVATAPTATCAGTAANSTNSARFGFKSSPNAYNGDGVLIFIVCEDGVIWQKDDNTAPAAGDTYPTDPGSTTNKYSQFGA